MKKKILFIITQSEFGGAQRFLDTLVRQLSNETYDILVATGSTGDEHFSEHLRNLAIPNTTISSLVRDPSLFSDIKAIFEIKSLINSFSPDTLFLLSSKAGFIGSFAARNKKIKVIYRIGGWAFNDPQNPLRRWFIMVAERFSARWKDYIVVNNKHDLDQAAQLGIRPRNNTLLIHNGLDVYKMKFLPREEARHQLKLTAPLIIGTIANFYPSKGLEYFVQAAKTFEHRHDIAFVIIGTGKFPPPPSPNVVLLGRIPEAAKYLSAFDIFVSPSVKEGFQWAVVEAMTAKIPVIATRVGAMPEVIQDGKNGFLVSPRSSEEIVEKLMTLLGQERLRQEFGIQGHQTILFQFSSTHMVQAVEKIL